MLQTVIQQVNIPITMVFSKLLLYVHYTPNQYVGSLLIIFGSLVASLPELQSSGGLMTSGLIGPTVLLVGMLPNSLSNVVKEKAFKDSHMDVFFSTVCVSTYQVVLGFVAAPIMSLKLFGGIALSDIPCNMKAGWECFLGQHIEGYHCHTGTHPATLLISYVLINFAYNVLLLLITKHGSALLLVCASALSLPIIQISFSLPFLMGEDAETLSSYNFLGLAIVTIGFLLYALVLNEETGEFLPMQGAGGQQVFVEFEVNPQIRRRHSFDITDSPSIQFALKERRRNQKVKYSSRRQQCQLVISHNVTDDVTLTGSRTP